MSKFQRAKLPGMSSIFGGTPTPPAAKTEDGSKTPPAEECRETMKAGPAQKPPEAARPTPPITIPKRRVTDITKAPQKGDAPNYLFGRALPVRSTIYFSDEVDRVLEQVRLRLRNRRAFRKITRSELTDAALKAFLANPEAVEQALIEQLGKSAEIPETSETQESSGESSRVPA